MRILVVGAGAIGGYFGGRLKDAGRDVTFLVRARRAAQLAKTGLVIRSRFGDVDLPSPPTVTAEALREPFDLILLSCKAYDLASAAESFAPAVGPKTAILPLLNGMAHMDLLATRFGAAAVLGGQCVISTTLDAEGRILHLNDTHLLSFGEPDGTMSERAKAIAATLSGAGFELAAQQAILQEMWEKWVLISTMAGITCLMRANVGDIVDCRCRGICDSDAGRVLRHRRAAGLCAPRSDHRTQPDHADARAARPLPRRCCATSSAARRSRPTTSSAICCAAARKQPRDYPLLRIAYAHLKAYEARRTREKAAAAAA